MRIKVGAGPAGAKISSAKRHDLCYQAAFDAAISWFPALRRRQSLALSPEFGSTADGYAAPIR
jgi:hypothetical protein